MLIDKNKELSSLSILFRPFYAGLFLFLLALVSLDALAQVQVSGSNGVDGTYSSLTTSNGAFDAINGASQTGRNIIITITANLNNENGPRSLEANNWTSLTIKPIGNRTVTCNASQPLIELDGADNVIIDGLNTGGNSLTFVNQSTSSGNRTSTLSFALDASNNLIQNCTFLGGSNRETTGTIFFDEGNTTGNDNNIIRNCVIGAVGALPYNAIFSIGKSSSIDNSNNIISNNQILDFYNQGGISNGIYLSSFNSSWTISSNKFYQSNTRNASNNAAIYRAINIVSNTGTNFKIKNNVIGFATSNSTGQTIIAGNFLHKIIAIEVSVGTSTPSSIDSNIISGFNLTTQNIINGTGVFAGISILEGRVDIGLSNGNQIGSASTNDVITISSNLTGALIHGIYIKSTQTVNVYSNSIGGISASGGSSIGFDLIGIYIEGAGGNCNVFNNLIGSNSNTNAIKVGMSSTTTGICNFTGIRTLNTGNKTIQNNTIRNCTVYGTGLSNYHGIFNSGSSGTLLIKGNLVSSGTNTGSSTTNAGLFNCILNSGAVSIATIRKNSLINHLRSNSTALFTGISNTGAVIATIAIDSNQLGNSTSNLVSFTAANSRPLVGINNSGGTTNTNLTITYNDVSGIIYSTTSSSTHSYIINSSATLTQNINFNTFTNLSVNTSGSILFISNSVAMPANGVQNIIGNRIVGTYTNLANTGLITLFVSTAATVATNVKITHRNNNFSNLNVAGAAVIAGWRCQDLGTTNPTRKFSNNVFRNWNGGTGNITVLDLTITSNNNITDSNVISKISNSGSIIGITTGSGSNANGNYIIKTNRIDTLISSGTAVNVIGIQSLPAGASRGITNNLIFHLQANNLTTGLITAISITGGSNITIDRNKIYNIFSGSSSISTGIISGISISGNQSALQVSLINNLIGDIRATAINSANNLFGIYINNSGTLSSIKLYYNTIYINNSSTGNLFGSSGVYHLVSSVITTSNLLMRNNIIVNGSTPKGAGITSAFRRSARNFNNYNDSSNSNLFYSGAPSSNRVIYYDVASFQTLANYQTLIGSVKDAASVTDDMISTSKFVTTNGFSNNFLAIDSNQFCFAESGGRRIVGITTDYNNGIRYGNAGYNGNGYAPDIGAYEIGGQWLWTGLVDSNWLETGNWYGSKLPNSNVSLTLGNGLPNYPLISSGTVTLKNLFLKTGAKLKVQNATLQISGNLNSEGTINAENGTLEFNGTSSQLIPTSTLTNKKISNLIISNSEGVTIKDTLNLSGILKINNGVFYTQDKCRLLSNASQTALIDGSGNGEVSGKIIIQRYIDTAFGYKFLSSPFDSLKFSQLDKEIDFNASFPEVYSYDENQQESGWIDHSDTSNYFVPMHGYAFNFGSKQVTKTIELTGHVNNNDLKIELFNSDRPLTRGFNLVGNPYPSPIDWDVKDGWVKTNIDDAIYYFDAGNSNYYLGTYSSYIKGISSNGIAGPTIGTMQGFFVHVSEGSFPVSGILAFSNKVRVNNLTKKLHKRDSVNSIPLVRLACFYEGSNLKKDYSVIYFEHESSDKFNSNFDALKVLNTDLEVPNLFSYKSDYKKLSIQSTSFTTDSILQYPLGLINQKGKALTIELKDFVNIPDKYSIYLYDAYQGELHDLRKSKLYSFSSNLSSDNTRLSLILSLKNLNHLSGKSKTFQVTNQQKQVTVTLNPLIENANLHITNMLGQELCNEKIWGGIEFKLNQTLNPGIYCFTTVSKQGVYTKKVMVL